MQGDGQDNLRGFYVYEKFSSWPFSYSSVTPPIQEQLYAEH